MVDFPNEADAEKPVDPIADFIKFVKEPKPYIAPPKKQCGYCKSFNRISHCNANWGECDCPQCQGFCECS
jgi:hypothetical protein